MSSYESPSCKNGTCSSMISEYFTVLMYNSSNSWVRFSWSIVNRLVNFIKFSALHAVVKLVQLLTSLISKTSDDSTLVCPCLWVGVVHNNLYPNHGTTCLSFKTCRSKTFDRLTYSLHDNLITVFIY